MARSLSELIKPIRPVELDEVDIKQFVDRFIRKALGDGAVCRRVSQGTAEITVSSPAIYQEVWLLGFDLIKSTQVETGYQLKSIKIRQS